MTAQAIATTTAPRSLVVKFAERFGVDSDKLLATLKATCFKTKDPATNEQMMALLVVADQYRLNPFTKEIFAFEDKHKGIVPVVSVDGWARIINEHPQYDGVEFVYSETITMQKDAKPCPEWCEAHIYRKDRGRPIIVREYLDEVFQPPRGGYSGPWQTHTKRFLRHKTFIQCSRIAFGFAGIYDEDEAGRIIEGEAVRVAANAGPVTDASTIGDLSARLEARGKAADVVDAEFTERKPDPAAKTTKEIRAALHLAESVDAAMALCDAIKLIPDDAEREELLVLQDSRVLALQ